MANSSVTPETDAEHWRDLATAHIQVQMQRGKISHFYPSGIHSVLMQMWVIQWGIESPQQIAGVRKPKQRPLQALMASSIISKSLMCALHSLFYLLLPLSALLFLHLTLPRSLLLSFSSNPLFPRFFIKSVFREGAHSCTRHLFGSYACLSVTHQSA